MSFEEVKDKSGKVLYYKVNFLVSADDVANNPGAKLLSDLVNDDKTFLFQVGGKVEEQFSGGKTRIRDVDVDNGGNITRQRKGPGASSPTDPEVDSIIFAPSRPIKIGITGQDILPISTFIHEAAEAFLLTKGVGYMNAHGALYGYSDTRTGEREKYAYHPQNAITREAVIRMQLKIGGDPAGFSRYYGQPVDQRSK